MFLTANGTTITLLLCYVIQRITVGVTRLSIPAFRSRGTHLHATGQSGRATVRGLILRARYDGIYKDLKAQIVEGGFGYGTYLPSEAQLTQAYACSHNTLRRALALLRDQGFVQPVHGKGVRVIWREPERTTFSIGGIESMQEVALRTGAHISTRVIDLKHIRCTPELAQRTGFAPNTPLICCERVRTIDGEALIVDKSLFDAKVVPDLTTSIAEKGIYDYLENSLGVHIATSKRTIRGERATQHDAELLDLGDVDWVAVLCSSTFDGQGNLIEVTESRHRMDRFYFVDTATRQKL